MDPTQLYRKRMIKRPPLLFRSSLLTSSHQVRFDLPSQLFRVQISSYKCLSSSSILRPIPSISCFIHSVIVFLSQSEEPPKHFKTIYLFNDNCFSFRLELKETIAELDQKENRQMKTTERERYDEMENELLSQPSLVASSRSLSNFSWSFINASRGVPLEFSSLLTRRPRIVE